MNNINNSLDYILYVLMKEIEVLNFSALSQFKNESRYVIHYENVNTVNECLIVDLIKNDFLHVIPNLYMMIIIFIFVRIVYEIYVEKQKLFPTRVQYGIESIYLNFSLVITEQLEKKGNKFYLYLINLFSIIFMFNIMGLIPYTTTITAQISVTFTLSIGILISLIILGVKENKENFISYFIPSGTPSMMIPYIMIIELISFLSKGFSLGIRLTANMFAGHVLLNIISKGIMFFFFGGNLLLIVVGVGMIFLILLIGLETLIAFLQSYVFVILTTIYVKEIFNTH